MFTTDQYRVFSGAPADRLLARPRRLLHDGQLVEAEMAYLAAMEEQPEVRQSWLEYFALLRHQRRFDAALALADRAAAFFGSDALPAALRGAALVELGRFREGLAALDDAASRDPDMGLVWHEAGYAAWRLGEFSRALIALDRAFALEPHGGTLHLRGKVLRESGRYLAAEVAFEGAAEAAEYQVQREAAEREIRITRRFAAFPGSRPSRLPPPRVWFAETGGVPLSGGTVAPVPEIELALAAATLGRDLGWRFSVLVALDGWPGWYDLAAALGIPVTPELPGEDRALPLLAIRHPESRADWPALAAALTARGRGACLALHQPRESAPADLAGAVGAVGKLDLAFAVEAAQHPEGRLKDRVLS